MTSQLKIALAAGLTLVTGAGGCSLDMSGLAADAQPGPGPTSDAGQDSAADSSVFDLAGLPDLQTIDGVADASDTPIIIDAATDTDASSDGGADHAGDVAQVSPAVSGCADGTREGLLSLDSYPNVAACDGAWDKPGLLSSLARAPACNRRGGNDGAQASGVGCSTADLCALGWHVCESAAEVQTSGGQCADAILPANGRKVFYATRQDGACPAAGDGSADAGPGPAISPGAIHGCGNFGDADPLCLPLGVILTPSLCAANAPWFCPASSAAPPSTAITTVSKADASHGGVLCCRD